jgi:hypothetical protein
MQITEFEQLLTETFPRWYRTEVLYPQIVKIEMTGNGFLDQLDEAKARQIIQLMKSMLPADTALYWRSDTRLVDTARKEVFYFYVASEEEEPPPPFRLDDLLALLIENKAKIPLLKKTDSKL